jgi:hypothetical protein
MEKRMREMRKDWIDQTKVIPVMLPGILLMLCVLIVLSLPAGAAQLSKTAKPCKPVGSVNSSDGTVYEKGQYGGKFEYITFKQYQLYDGDDGGGWRIGYRKGTALPHDGHEKGNVLLDVEKPRPGGPF